MRIITLNVNGIRSAARKGLFAWLVRQRAHLVCLQEVKAQVADLSDEMRQPKGFQGFFHLAAKKGYSGVGIYARRKPDQVVEGVGIADIDAEGRYLRADFGRLSVVSLYMPSGSSSPERQVAKFRFMERFLPMLGGLHGSGREWIICGDWNIAHKEIDLKNWRGNQKNSGFLPEERAWLGQVFDQLG
nr:exodeoxyribonuclease III [Burkholderiales bacterium]